MDEELIIDGRALRVMTPEQYRRYFEEETRREVYRGGERAAHLKINLHRTRRIEKTYRVSAGLRAAAEAVAAAQRWIVLTEPWCGDSAQCLPYIAGIAACSRYIDLKLILRDQIPDIMDRYLTNGSRSIPKLVVFGDGGAELFRWGPRPREAMELFRSLKEEGLPKDKIIERVHGWYGRNRGRAIEEEFFDLLAALKSEE